ncbi:MAG: dienelactone hydrolase family protein [Clostridia bacterium]|nr:dienelactone hydrolase family protein [Clostridia bacterium]
MNELRHYQPAVSFPKLPYIFTAPTDWDPAKESLPLIVFLHGAGERGEDPAPLREFYGIPRLFGEDPDYHGLRVLTLSPQCPNGLVWNNLTLAVRDLIETVVTENNVDRNAITITGCSMGGFGTWEMICAYPELFAAAAPICGGGLSWRASQIKHLPLRVFHGGVDSVVPLWYSETMVKAIENAGGNVTLTVFPGVDHDSWIPAYRDTDVIDWLAAQRRS